jgi:hypothetical protein
MNMWSFDITETNLALSCVCGSASAIEFVTTDTNKAAYTELFATLEWVEPYFTLVTVCHTLGNQNCLPKGFQALGTAKLS